ncbi:DUF2924 domain-containing protein [Qipengyuania oceanensis]|uniref:DUF2924 domain-containing protein n=1 Tax=Qipengyuania oceanensis TaxID=1463597 RepID=A0A844YFI5_9SPHN|nr:DUF2924 domain-containing protein [Qipengyuania oceanensis]MXO63936.1 DUF2924 domain-containing protein [Qipengyuania oceanensis]
MSTDLETAIAEIEAMDLVGLRSEWRRRYGPPPPLRSEPFMRMLLAWRVQADGLGGIDTHTQRALARKGAPMAEGLELGVGARLTRNWKGRAIEVIVEEDGFRFGGQLFPSLSAAATAIAGSQWNGPRFFGLRDA